MTPFDDAMAKMMCSAMDKAAGEKKASQGFPKLCPCCGSLLTAKAWRGMAIAGIQPDEEGGDLELRSCPCGSTLSIKVLESKDIECNSGGGES